MLVVLTETYCNEVNIQITQRDDFVQKKVVFVNIPQVSPSKLILVSHLMFLFWSVFSYVEWLMTSVMGVDVTPHSLSGRYQ